MMNIFENKWDLDLHKIWIETCVYLNKKNDIMNYFYEKIDIIKEEKEILDFYYNKAVEFEENGDYKTASIILEEFVNQDIKYRDAFTRYQKLLVKLEIGNTSNQKIEIKEKDSNQVFDPNLTRVVSEESINKKYEFIREIGQGGMGIVYEAKDRKLNRKVAIKKLKEELSINPREKKRFIEEAQNVAILNHPNIISIYEIVEEGKDVYIVFEFIDGKTVNEILSDTNRIDIKKSVYIVKEVCKALSYSHSKNIVHRDIKPSNIMIANPPVSPFDKEGIKEGFVKVMDFGIARELKDTLTRLTGMVDTSGTFAYMAPEQHLGKFYKSSDIYSLGITLYEMICGELPFKGPDFLAQKRELAYKSIKEIIPEAPEEIEKIISKCLNNDLEKRYKSADELLEELEKLKI
jgi:serine/threonine protein kinase